MSSVCCVFLENAQASLALFCLRLALLANQLTRGHDANLTFAIGRHLGAAVSEKQPKAVAINAPINRLALHYYPLNGLGELPHNAQLDRMSTTKSAGGIKFRLIFSYKV